MRVLMVNEYIPPVTPGGAEWSSYHLMEALSERGHQIAVATVNHGPAPQPPANVQAFSMAFPFKLAAGSSSHPQGLLENFVFHFAFAIHIARTVRRFRPDVIHAQTKNSLVGATLAARTLGVPLAYTLRDIGIVCPYGMCYLNGHDVNRCGLRVSLGGCSDFLVRHYTDGSVVARIKVALRALYLWPDTWLKQACLKRVQARIAPSVQLVNALPKRLSFGSLEWTIIPHLPPSSGSALLKEAARDQNGGKHMPKGPYVLYLGKLSPGKGLPVLQEAVRELAPEFPAVRFVFAGKGQWRVPKDLPIDQIGPVDQPTAHRLIQDADIVVVPSLVPEAFNRVVLEAMTYGKAVIASDAGALAEQIEHGKSGWTVPKGSASGLADGMRLLLRDPAMRERLGAAARERVATVYSREGSVRRLEAAYLKLETDHQPLQWDLLSAPKRWFLRSLIRFNDKAKRLAIHLVKWTGKDSQKIHPKHLLGPDTTYSWYLEHLRATDRVLDVGAGHGNHTLLTAARVKEAVGVELDPANLSVCLQRAEERRVTNVRFTSANAETGLAFPSESFDAVLMLDVLEHIVHRDAVLREMHRLLAPSGRLLVAVPNRRTRWKDALRRAGLFYYSDRDHKIEYTLTEIDEELDRNGFRRIEEPGTIVVDTPWVGAIDIVGGFSLSLYRRLMKWKVDYVRQHPEESIGFHIVAQKV